MGDRSEPGVGDRIADKYVVERVLGRGGMGLVLAARHAELGQLIAIKVILPAALRDPAAAERLLREARASARLRSEHVARVFDVGRTADGAPYLVMELLEGSDLNDVVQAQGALAAAQAALYVAQACEAIGEAHAAGIVHRDLKPANLFLTRRRDGSPCVKVLDFGIAKEEGFEGARMTSTGSVLGTPLYMPPEQLKSSRSASAASDVWALGITLYELATGCIPYDATTIPELFARILTERPVPPRERLPSLPLAFEAVIMRCLEADPARRWASAAELREALLPLASAVGPDWTSPPTAGAATTREFSVAATAHLHRPDDAEPPPPAAEPGPGRATAPGTARAVTAAGVTSSGKGGARALALGALVALAGVGAGGGLWWMRGRDRVAPTTSSAAPIAAAPVASASPEPTPSITPVVGSPEPTPALSASAAPSATASAATSAAPSATAPRAAGPTRPRPPPASSPPPPSPSPTKTGWGGML